MEKDIQYQLSKSDTWYSDKTNVDLSEYSLNISSLISPGVQVPIFSSLKSRPSDDMVRLKFQSGGRSEEHTSELQSLMRISYAVFCLKKKKIKLNSQIKVK